MERKRSTAFREARYHISKNLQSTRDICDYLVTKGELTDQLVESILSKPTRSDQNSELCKILATRGDSAYDSFREALLETNAPDHLLDKLPSFAQTQAQSTDRSSPQSSGLSDDLLKRIEKIEISDSVDALPSGIPKPKVSTSNQELGRYPVDPTKKTGLALIINNVDFAHMMKRKGSDVDHHNMRLLLRAFNFEIFEEEHTRNLRLGQMKDVLERFALQQDHQKYSSCVVVIMSHGKDGYLYATDSSSTNLLGVEWMLKLFHGDECPNLNGKPKLFFLQACRGERMDKGADLYGGDATDSAGDAPRGALEVPDNLSEEDEEQLYQDLLSHNYDETDAITRGDVIASQSDIFVAYATVPGYVSWRNSANGSWFIQAIVHVFQKWAFKYDLVSMMTEVNRLVQEKFSSSSGNYKMVPSQRSQLTKQFYFPTGN